MTARFMPALLWNYSQIALRKLRKQKAYSFINIVVMAVFVACLGLFGLASFAAEQQTKEIGIRKVLGASEAGLTALLSKEFLKWVLVANAIGLLASYVIAGRFQLANFPYRTKPGLLIFISVAGISLLIALLTVSWQAIRAAVADPVESLRYE